MGRPPAEPRAGSRLGHRLCHADIQTVKYAALAIPALLILVAAAFVQGAIAR